jgi:hypothetical protein
MKRSEATRVKNLITTLLITIIIGLGLGAVINNLSLSTYNDDNPTDFVCPDNAMCAEPMPYTDVRVGIPFPHSWYIRYPDGYVAGRDGNLKNKNAQTGNYLAAQAFAFAGLGMIKAFKRYAHTRH